MPCPLSWTRFLEKAVHLNQKTGRLFEPSDCLPGNIIQVPLGGAAGAHRAGSAV